MKWFSSEREDVDDLISRGKLERAIRLLEARLAKDRANTVVRQRLGDILGRAGHKDRAIAVLAPLIDEYSNQGFSAKAIAVIKKLERLDPGKINTGHLISKVRQVSETTETLPLVPAHLEDDTVELEAITPPKPKRQEKTSELSTNWLEQLEAKRPSFGWSPLLADLPAVAFDAVVSQLSLLVKNPGAIICAQGERAASVFVLASGYARAYRRAGKEPYQQMQVFEEGQYFGEEAVLEEEPRRPVTVTAASQCELLEIDLDSLGRITAANPSVKHHLEEMYDRRLWALGGRI